MNGARTGDEWDAEGGRAAVVSAHLVGTTMDATPAAAAADAAADDDAIGAKNSCHRASWRQHEACSLSVARTSCVIDDGTLRTVR